MKCVVVLVLGYRALPFLSKGSLASMVTAANRLGPALAALVYLDNYSRDGSLQWVAEHHPDVDLLVAPENYGYCRGTNAGLQYCERRYQPDYFVLADADNFAEPDAYVELIRFADRRTELGIVQPLIRGLQNRVKLYSCGHRYDDVGRCLPMEELPEDRLVLDNLLSCSISSTLVRREVLTACGLLDPIFHMYYESSDLGFRARRQGFRCACNPAAVTYHDGTDGTGLDQLHSRYYVNRNRLIFWRLHDLAQFERVREAQLAVYRGLQAEFMLSEFGISPEREAVRRGIEHGLRATSDHNLLPRQTVHLDDFQKSEVMVVRGRSSA